jgi:hypothetical protein
MNKSMMAAPLKKDQCGTKKELKIKMTAQEISFPRIHFDWNDQRSKNPAAD